MIRMSGQDRHRPIELFERQSADNLVRDGDFLVLYGIERGKRRIRVLFTSIYNALDFIALTYHGIPGLPFDWPEINRQFDEHKGT